MTQPSSSYRKLKIVLIFFIFLNFICCKTTNHSTAVDVVVVVVAFLFLNWKIQIAIENACCAHRGVLRYILSFHSENTALSDVKIGLSGVDCCPDICQLHLESRLAVYVNQLLDKRLDVISISKFIAAFPI